MYHHKPRLLASSLMIVGLMLVVISGMAPRVSANAPADSACFTIVASPNHAEENHSN